MEGNWGWSGGGEKSVNEVTELPATSFNLFK